MSHSIGGLELPQELVSAIQSGRWTPPEDTGTYLSVFGEEPEQPEFYDLDGMARQNESWQRLPSEKVFGEEIAGVSLGIDPRRSLVIGDLGPDLPIALDYRAGGDPRVLYLAYQGRPVWKLVAADVESLLLRLGA
ncbi:hypothetical protein DPM19_30095 [Actinomadura craniellae]|uniref:SMI1/KNR4 family protein n=1 Tax=Actinomadura craniellae TaxID=2231787 RepID=A0A365GXJ4_9ACTN|nr:SMI1/KNR4 family protein [Actinomadura craniellae]RAY11555.1 hypothetical protein DPM19_30095 [Actinomadura craniellae]